MNFKFYPPDRNPYYAYTLECEPISGFRVIVQSTPSDKRGISEVLFDGLEQIGIMRETVYIEDLTHPEPEFYTLHRVLGRL